MEKSALDSWAELTMARDVMAGPGARGAKNSGPIPRRGLTLSIQKIPMSDLLSLSPVIDDRSTLLDSVDTSENPSLVSKTSVTAFLRVKHSFLSCRSPPSWVMEVDVARDIRTHLLDLEDTCENRLIFLSASFTKNSGFKARGF